MVACSCLLLMFGTISSLLHWVSLFSLLLAIYGCGSLLWWLVRQRMRKELESMPGVMDSGEFVQPPRDRTATITKTAMILLAGTVGWGSGYVYRDWKLNTSKNTLTNVLVLNRESEVQYRLQTEQGQAFNAKFCQPMDLNPGEKLQVLVYEQRPGCKSISGNDLGFVAYTKIDGSRVKFPIKEMSDVR